MKYEIDLPELPEGWEFKGYKSVKKGEMFLDSYNNWHIACTSTHIQHLVAAEKTLWVAPPELNKVIKKGWVARDLDDHPETWWHESKPVFDEYDQSWDSEDEVIQLFGIKSEFLPPLGIPCNKCCFEVGFDEGDEIVPLRPDHMYNSLKKLYGE